MTEPNLLPRRRGLLAIPGSILLICLFLPALRVCGTPEYPVSFPPDYAAYLGGIGILIMALGARRRVLAIGASIPPVLAIATATAMAILALGINGGMYGAAVAVPIGVIGLISIVSLVRALLRRPPSSRAMATLTILQGLISTLWASLLAFDKDAMWGAHVTLFAGLAVVIGGIAWFRSTITAPVKLPTATAVSIGEPV